MGDPLSTSPRPQANASIPKFGPEAQPSPWPLTEVAHFVVLHRPDAVPLAAFMIPQYPLHSAPAAHRGLVNRLDDLAQVDR
jgi:hypothetical protein